MPVSVVIIIADPPAAPTGYTLCAYEVRSLQPSGPGALTTGTTAPIAIFAGSQAGFEDAANVLVSACRTILRDVGHGLRLAAVCWWIEEPMDHCTDGRERMVSVYDAGKGCWSEWAPEQKTGHGSPIYGAGKWTRDQVKRGRARRQLGSILNDND